MFCWKLFYHLKAKYIIFNSIKLSIQVLWAVTIIPAEAKIHFAAESVVTVVSGFDSSL